MGGGEASHRRPEEGGGGHLEYGGPKVGPPEEDEDCPGAWNASAAAASIGDAGGCLRYQPGECDVVGGALQKRMAV